MTEPQEPKRREAGVIINYNEPRVKPPPLLEVGALAWIRKNLLSSPLDAILTVVGIFLVVLVVVGTIQWTIQRGDWNAIILNLSTFMTGRLPDEYIPRISMVVLVFAFAMGAGVAAYTRRLSPFVPAILVILILPVLLLPPLARAIVPIPPMYLTGGNTDIVAGSATETPLPQVAFIARTGEVITFSFAATGDDVSLARVDGFMDRSTNTLRNAAETRMADIARYTDVVMALIHDAATLTASGGAYGELTPRLRTAYQKEISRLSYVIPDKPTARAIEIQLLMTDPRPGAFDTKALTEELAGLTFPPDVNIQAKLKGFAASPDSIEPFRATLQSLATPPTVVDTYGVNKQPVHLVLSNAKSEVLADWTLKPGDAPVSFTIPEDAWYLLDKTVVGDDASDAVIAAVGIYPIKARTIDFMRISDKWVLASPLPKVDGEDAHPVVLVENKYRGDRSFQAYIRLYVTNFFSDISLTVLGAAVAAVIGFFVSRYLDRLYSPSTSPRKASRRLMQYLIVVVLFSTYTLINGIDTLSYAVLIAWIVGIVLAFRIGQRVYVSSDTIRQRRLIIGLVILAVTAGLIYIAPVLLYGSSAPPTDLVYDVLGGAAVMFSYMLGAFSGSGETVDVIDRRMRRMAALVVALYVVPALIGMFAPASIRSSIQSFVPYTDPRTWGGLLLAIFITIYGTILAFPLGILLALGRRSTLPAIKYPCTAIIEVVRGTPFIVVLFAGQLLIPLINPRFADIPNVYRALGATVLFIAAYLAENVRGGLQSIPGGQQEAGRALGIPDWQITIFVTLPQALRAVIPALVGQIISLFIDTSLLDIVGLIDLSRTVTGVVAQAEFNDARREGLVFITIIYFTVSYVVSYISRRIEESGSGAARRI